MRRFLIFAIVPALLAFPASALAIVNVEQAIIGPSEDGFHNRAEVAVDGSSGNTVKTTARAELLSQWQHGRHAEFLWGQYAYGKSSGVVDTNRYFVHLRHRTMVGERWGVEVFGQIGRDPFARMSLRTLLGGGVRWTLMEKANKAAVYFGLGAFHEHEKLSPKAGTTDALDSRLWRGNSYLVLKGQLNDHVRLYNTTYYQPAFRDMADYRILEQFSVAVGLAENLDLKLSLDVVHDSKPPQGVRKTDVRYSTGLAVDF